MHSTLTNQHSNFQVVVPQSGQVEPQKNVLYISDLPQNVTELDIINFFDEYKDNIVMINILGGKVYDTSGKTLNAKVIFRDFKTADEARKEKNMNKIKGKTIRIMWDEVDRSQRYNNQGNIFVKNIPFEIKPREFYEFYLQFGDISSSKVPEDEDGSQLGYGYINYADPESAAKAIKATDGKEIWGSILEVKIFQKKNERFGTYPTSNTSIYVKNFPVSYGEKELRGVFGKFGEILSFRLTTDDFNRVYAILSYPSEESAMKAKTSLNGQKLTTDENELPLFVDILMSKVDRKKLLSTRINDSNHKLNEQYKYCNLHIRNIPFYAKEEDLMEAFKKYGQIKSVKIDKYTLVTKVNGELKEIPTSKGFGYVCFEEPEAAKQALEEMHDKFLPKYETWKRPLIIEYFMPKGERTHVVVNKINQTNTMENPKLPMMMNPMMRRDFNMMNPMGMNPNMMNMNPKMMNSLNMNMQNMMLNPYMNQPQMRQGGGQGYNKNTNKKYQGQNFTQQQPRTEQKPVTKNEPQDDLDYNYLNSLDTDSKRDYLGEFLFKKIENHKLSQQHFLTIDNIGKITGMILGIEDINEIIDIYRNSDVLTSRISEAIDLINQKN